MLGMMTSLINNPLLRLGDPLLDGANGTVTSVQQVVTVAGAAAIIYGYFADARVAQWGAIAVGATLVIAAVRGAPVVPGVD